ncbi:helix-turn-helix transcriptional regulator [Bradyrhizobium elkanii]|jgi:prophage regulatory protein|uniref:Prophage regulatory protein n=1 Tax=Bradyrhizobium elkanii TaxID=29448 RepID=A0ABV4F2K3_BRAEL|nr:AlpA family phage regulatory protein [Bradyrhizobium elkanii]MCS3890473.1 prophage regulatory protein [Bradyrhizobium elkanii]MCS4219927.1 prophage regulatory protein [Bradyrhizobium elkanii]WLB13666.1 AlpA family phage regulatory protein [Bradyrhizobium elkanii]
MTDTDAPEPVKQDNELRQMITMKQVLAKVPFSRSTLLRQVEEGNFPKPRQIASGRVAWYLDEVVEWQRELDRKVA